MGTKPAQQRIIAKSRSMLRPASWPIYTLPVKSEKRKKAKKKIKLRQVKLRRQERGN